LSDSSDNLFSRLQFSKSQSFQKEESRKWIQINMYEVSLWASGGFLLSKITKTKCVTEIRTKIYTYKNTPSSSGMFLK